MWIGNDIIEHFRRDCLPSLEGRWKSSHLQSSAVGHIRIAYSQSPFLQPLQVVTEEGAVENWTGVF